MTGDEDRDRVVELEISDTLDLHSFRPQDVAGVVKSYLEEASKRGIRHLRIIHGRGRGVQRRTVRSILRSDARVAAYSDAPPSAGGWGATTVTLRSANSERD